MWKPDDALLDEAADQLADALSRVQAAEGDKLRTAALEALEAAGTLVACGARAKAEELLGGADAIGLPEKTRRALLEAARAVCPDELDDAAAEIAELAPELALVSEADRAALEERVASALQLRDSIELVLEGARAAFSNPALPPELDASLESFDELVRPEVWRTLALGERRAARALWMAPAYRARFWWWSKGCDLPADSLDSLAIAARVLAVFPEARGHFEQLIDAERTLESGRPEAARSSALCEERPLAEVIPLFARIRRSHPQRQAQALAAATEETWLVAEAKSAVVTADDEMLYVDYREGCAPAHRRPPTLEVEGQPPLPGGKSAAACGSFEWSLGAPQFRQPKARLRIPVESGEEIVELG